MRDPNFCSFGYFVEIFDFAIAEDWNFKIRIIFQMLLNSICSR